MKMLVLSALLLVCFSFFSLADAAVGPEAEKLQAAREKAIEYLKSSQSDDGTWTTSRTAGISALVIYGMIESGVDESDPTVTKALERLEQYANDDGSIASPKSPHVAYETAVCMMTLIAANKSGKYDKLIEAGEKYIRGIQFDEEKGVERSDPHFGGMGYSGNGSRPDLSNTAYCLEALNAAGVSANDPAFQKALIFISRCQNLESEHNTSPVAAKVNDGGFMYTPAPGGDAPTGETAEAGLRSYGSMTYAGLKSMIYAGLDRDDPRVRAAENWIQKHYTLDSNPGMGPNGLFYYYQLFGKALDTLDQDTLVDDEMVSHDWRKELAEKLFALQKPNGSWVNTESDRWFEGDPNLVTAFALIALKSCEPEPGN